MDVSVEGEEGEERVLDVWQLKSWGEQEEEEIVKGEDMPLNSIPTHAKPPYDIDQEVNCKICLWSGEVSVVAAGAVVHCTNEAFTDDAYDTRKLFRRAGPELRRYLIQEIKTCSTGEVEVSGGYNLAARYILHTVPPLYTIRYHTAATTTLYRCYRRVLETCGEYGVTSVAVPVLSSPHYPYPAEPAAHVALRTLRWYLSTRRKNCLRRVVLVLPADALAAYTRLLPLYFPRTPRHQHLATYLLPADLGSECGEPVVAERQIRIIDNPQHTIQEGEAGGVAGGVRAMETSINVGEHAFTRMEEDVDRQRLLGAAAPPATADSLSVAITTDLQKKQRYERLLRRARTEDLREVAGIGFLYECGHDKLGRTIIIFIGKWFNYNTINREKAVLYLLNVLEPVARSDYVIIYFHTLTGTENHPALSWIREIYDTLDYKYKKNLKQFYIVHPTLWTKIMTWWFTTFMAPQIKHKVVSITGIEYLYENIDPDKLEIPAYITEHDMTINGVRYYKGSPSS